MVSPQKISSYLRKPYELDAEAEHELRSLIKETPYFSNAWLLLSRSLHNQQSPLFDDTLKQAAMFAGDRQLLYALVNLADKQTAAEPLHTFATDAQAAPLPTERTVQEEQPAPPAEPETPAETSPVASAEEPAYTAPQTEQEKVVSAYDDIFGAPTNKNEDVKAEFESFDSEPAHHTEDIHTEEDFELAVADHIAEDHEEIINTAPAAEHTEEDFELEIADHLIEDKTHSEPPAEEHSEEDFELAVADHIAKDHSAYQPPADEHTEEEFELEIADHLADEHEHFAPATQEETPQEELLSAQPAAEVHAFEARGTEVPEMPAPLAEEEKAIRFEPAFTAEPEIEEAATADETENIEIAEETLGEPIAFKLGRKEETPAAETAAQPVAETPVRESETEPANFFEWLQQLKRIDGAPQEKKNDVVIFAPALTTEKPVKEETTVAEIPAANKVAEQPATEIPAKPSVDDIINRFIHQNPTISRPKAEFFNPVVKAKDSDTEKDDLATETLAKIYLKQNLTEKALAIYEKLKNIYPAKAQYFQSVIDEVSGKK